MNAEEDPERTSSERSPHLSHSRINRYLLCPEQYRLYYVERLRPRVQAASLMFGQAVHMALAFLFRQGADPVESFNELWATTRQLDLRYSKRESWERLQESGRALLQKFVKEELPRITNVRASEKEFELQVSNLALPLVGIIDLVADLDGKPTITDFKTSISSYEEYEAELSDQLSTYLLAEPEVDQAALCVFVKTKEPRIEWQVATRDGADLVEYLAKAKYVAGEIATQRFYKRPGKWCSWCDYLPVCLKDNGAIAETLVRV